MSCYEFMPPNHANPAWRPGLQSARLVRRVAELGSLIWPQRERFDFELAFGAGDGSVRSGFRDERVGTSEGFTLSLA